VSIGLIGRLVSSRLETFPWRWLTPVIKKEPKEKERESREQEKFGKYPPRTYYFSVEKV